MGIMLRGGVLWCSAGLSPDLTPSASRSHEGDAHFLILRPVVVEHASGHEAVSRSGTTAGKTVRWWDRAPKTGVKILLLISNT